jgi:hypothetical protein
MSLLSDDDDDLPSRSSAEYVTRADHGKKDQREKNAAHKGHLLSLKREMLRNQMDGKKADQAVSQQRQPDADAQKSMQAPEASIAGSANTMTNDEQAKKQLHDAKKKEDAQTLQHKDRLQNAAKQQSSQEYQQDMG